MQDGQRAEDAILKIGDVCEIQHAQLHYASTSLFDSVETILTKLHNMRSSQREITTDLESGSVGDRRSHSFLDEITANMSSVTNLLQEYGKTTATMDDMIRNVLSTINEITTFVQDVEHFGSEIIQIALNARIKAVCTGQEGAAMSSLSDEVGQLSKEAIQRTELIATALGEIHAITETITRKSGADQAAMLERFNDMQQQLDRLLASLKSVGSEVHTLIARMQVQGATLAKELDQITRSTDVHKRIQRMAAGVLANLEQVFTAARQLYPASEAFKEELHSLASRYTMESERRIHAEIARKHGVTIAISAQPADSTPESASEFGDNVDLF
jgi:methyl-accepting chemotaxis protein